MRRFRAVLTIAWFIAVSGSAQAGIYCSLDQLPFPVPTNFKPVYSKLGDLRAVVNTDTPQAQNPFWQKYDKRAKELEAKDRHGELTTDERIDLSGIYLRENRHGDARQVLEKADHTHFLVLAHLAMVYEGLGLPEQGLTYEEKALEAWPAVWPNVWVRWNADQLSWYRRAERYYLELLRLRQQEKRTASGSTAPKTVDALFPRLRFDSPEGRYLVGGPRPTRGDRLQDDVPPDALQIVTQLMWWLPFDNRLFWLYGELLNYHGDVVNAQTIIEEFFKFKGGRQPSNDTLRRHRRELAENLSIWQNRNWIFYAAAPRLLRTDLVASYLQEVGLFQACQAGEALYNPEAALASSAPLAPPPADVPAAAPATPATAPTSGWLPDWRTVIVSFTAGMLFMALLLLQWREWSRRRGLAPPSRRQFAD